MLVRARKKQRFHRKRSSLRVWKPDRKLERYCPKCNRLYASSPYPKEEHQLVCGSTVALVYSGKRFFRKEYTVRIGRWQAYARNLVVSELYGRNDLDDLAKIAAMARDYIDLHLNPPPPPRSVVLGRQLGH